MVIQYKKAESEYLPQLIDICAVCFNEEVEEVIPVFNSYLSVDMCYCAVDDNKILANVFLVPCTINVQRGTAKGHYLYGAATLPQCRGQRIMNNLIEYALKCAVNKGDAFSVLLPADDSLYDFYEKQGYTPACRAKSFTLKYDEIQTGGLDKITVTKTAFDNIEQLRFNICRNNIGSINWGKNIIDFAIEQATASRGGILCCEKGYIIYFRESKDTVFVTEFMCLEQDYITMLATLKNNVTALKYHLRLPPWLSENKADRFGMIRWLKTNNVDISTDIYPYLGMTFD